jgi:hypothetical protein
LKRDENLAPLSRDHHRGLVTAKILRYDELPEDDEEPGVRDKMEHVQSYWDTDLFVHFENENEILYPFVKGRDALLDKMLERMKKEHIKISGMVKNLESAADFEKAIDELGRMMEAHIRFEERELFEKIQEIFTHEELSALAGKFVSVR